MLPSFQDLAATVAAVEKTAARPMVQPTEQSPVGTVQSVEPPHTPHSPRYMRLPNPQIPVHEYNLVSQYCSAFPNMTRQDFVELAIIEKLHAEEQLTDEEFGARREEIRKRPPRGQRKGMKSN